MVRSFDFRSKSQWPQNSRFPCLVHVIRWMTLQAYAPKFIFFISPERRIRNCLPGKKIYLCTRKNPTQVFFAHGVFLCNSAHDHWTHELKIKWSSLGFFLWKHNSISLFRRSLSHSLSLALDPLTCKIALDWSGSHHIVIAIFHWSTYKLNAEIENTRVRFSALDEI